MKKLLCLLLIITFYTKLQAQEKPAYRSFNTVGIAIGDSKSAYQVFTSHGVSYKSWYAGIGTGVDDYRNRSVPVILSVARYLLPQNNLFVQMNAGPNFVWGKGERNRLWNQLDSKAFPGLFAEAGFGFRLETRNPEQGILFGTYYSYKNFKEKFVVPGNCSNPPCDNMNEYIKSGFSRWAFKMGFVF